MKKIYFTIALTFLFFFLFVPKDTFAKTTYELLQDKDKYKVNEENNIYSNLDFAIDSSSGQKFSFGYSNTMYLGQRTETSDLKNTWAIYPNSTTSNDLKFPLNSSNSTINSFLYGMSGTLYGPFEVNKKYEVSFVFSITDNTDYYEAFEYIDDINLVGFDGSNWYYDFITKRLGYYMRDEDDSRFAIFTLQLEVSNPMTLINFYIGEVGPYEKDDSGYNDNTIHYLDNFTNNTINIFLYELWFFEVTEFADNPQDIIPSGGGITFDGERTDDNIFGDNTLACDTLDFTCHFNNLKNWFTILGRRISNAFETIITFFTDFFDSILSFLKDVFIPDLDYISTQFDGLFKFIDAKLGFLTFPFDFSVYFLEKFLNISNTPIKDITVPNITLGSFGTIIHGFTFNIAEYWEKAPFKQIYDIYLIFVHAFIVFGLYKLSLKKFNEMTGGSSS